MSKLTERLARALYPNAFDPKFQWNHVVGGACQRDLGLEQAEVVIKELRLDQLVNQLERTSTSVSLLVAMWEHLELDTEKDQRQHQRVLAETRKSIELLDTTARNLREETE